MNIATNLCKLFAATALLGSTALAEPGGNAFAPTPFGAVASAATITLPRIQVPEMQPAVNTTAEKSAVAPYCYWEYQYVWNCTPYGCGYVYRYVYVCI